MIDWLTGVIQAVALGLAVWFLVETIRKRLVSRAHLIGLGLLEALLVVQLVVSIVKLLSQNGSEDVAMFIGYLMSAVLIPPVAGIWGNIDRSHWGTAVVAGASATVAVLLLRMDQIWNYATV